MASASSLLRIDEVRAVETIKLYLQKLYDQHLANGVILGLSGGIDSSVLSALAVRALGKESVHVVHLYDRESEEELGRKASLVANWLGLQLEARSIEPAMHDRGVYSPFIMRIASLSGLINRILHGSYRLIVGETPFMSSLRAGGADSIDGECQSRGLKLAIQYPEAGFNARHIYRREILEFEANAQNYLLLGAANRTEWLVGWFVKGGVDDLPIQPLKGLYKTQIRQLASYLGMPDEIQTQAPSPDMMKGITDELALGMSYSKIDIALDFLEGGLSEEEVIAMGITNEELFLVREMKRLSSWKRESVQIPPPVDGGPFGGLRLQA